MSNTFINFSQSTTRVGSSSLNSCFSLGDKYVLDNQEVFKKLKLVGKLHYVILEKWFQVGRDDGQLFLERTKRLQQVLLLLHSDD